MNRIFAFLIVVLWVSISVASAQNGAETMADKSIEMFRKMDANNDGFITMDEVKAHHKKHFASIDTNKDDKISLEELLAAGRTKERFEELDSRKRGYLTFKDTLKVEEMRFKKADTNHDGKVSLEEYQAHHKEVTSKKT